MNVCMCAMEFISFMSEKWPQMHTCHHYLHHSLVSPRLLRKEQVIVITYKWREGERKEIKMDILGNAYS